MFTSGLEKGCNFIKVSGFYLVTPILCSLHVIGPPDFIPDHLKFYVCGPNGNLTKKEFQTLELHYWI